MNQTVRQRHGADIVPQGFSEPPVGSVMKNQKIADALILHVVETIEFIDEPRVYAGRSQPRHETDEIGNGCLDQVNAGGLEWLEKAAREADRHAIARPSSYAPSGGKSQKTRLSSCSAIQTGQQRVASFAVI